MRPGCPEAAGRWQTERTNQARSTQHITACNNDTRRNHDVGREEETLDATGLSTTTTDCTSVRNQEQDEHVNKTLTEESGAE
jgi:hypothetical protein